MHGFVKDPERYIKKARFVFTSGYLSMLGALILKKITFATYDNPVKKSYLLDSPFSKYVIIESDPKMLAERLISIIKDPTKESRRIEEAKKWAREQTWKRVADIYLKTWSR